MSANQQKGSGKESDAVAPKKHYQQHGTKEPKGHKQMRESGIQGVPMLDCPHGITNVESEWNFIAFSEGIAEYVEATYGDIASIFRTGGYPAYPEEVYNAADYEQAKDPLGLKIDALRERIRHREKKIAKLEDTKPMVYSVIKRQLSRQSLARVEAHSEYGQAEANRDPNKLWSIIVSTHLLNVKEKDADTARTKAQIAFNNCRMQPYESLADFYTRFTLRLEIYVTTWRVGDDEAKGIQAPFTISDSLAATYFVEKLDPERYGATQLSFRNHIYQKPKSVKEAFEFINTLSVPRKSQRSVFHQHQGRGRGRGGRGSEQYKQSGEATAQGEVKKKGPSAERPCAVCGAHNHWARDCPDADKDHEHKSDKAQPKKKTNLLTLPEDILDRHDVKDLVEESEGDIVVQGDVSGSVLLACDSLTEEDIVLDSGGSTSIFKNTRLGTTSPYATDDTVSIGGAVKGGGAIETSLKMDTAFGEVHYSQKCVANILSYSQVKDIAYLCYQRPEEDVFRIQMSEDSNEYIFERKLGIYVLTGEARTRQEATFIATVQRNQRGYSKYEVERADRARELVSRLGYPGTAKVIQMLNSGAIMNCDVSSADVLRAEEIYGPPLAALKGKTAANTATPDTGEEPIIGLQEVEHQTMNVDIMYVKGIPFLLNVLTPIRMMFAAKLKAKTTQSLFSALTGQIGDIKAKGFKPSKLKCDPERGFTAMKDILSEEYGVSVDTVGTGEHVRVVERGIRTIKERVRGIVNTLPYKLCSVLLVFLVLFCVSRINMTPSKAATTILSPWERFHQRKLDFSKNLKAGFGEYCQAHDNDTDNTLKSRTTGALTVFDTGSRDGTWYLFNLNTRKLIRRRKFTILPMPDIVISYLNAMHDAEDMEGEEIDFEFGGPENRLPVEDAVRADTEDEKDYEDYADRVAQRFISVRADDRVYDPVQYSEPSKAATTILSLWERFHQRKLDFSKNLKAGFGEYCQAHDNDTDNTLKSRTTGALTVFDTGSRDGTWYLFNLNTRKLIRRRKFTILPMPDIVISYLNAMHDAEDMEGEEIDFEFGGPENRLPVEDAVRADTEDEKDYEDYADRVAQRFISVRADDRVYDPVQYSEPDMLDEQDTAAGVPEPVIEEQDIQGVKAFDPEPDATTDSIYKPKRDGLRTSRAQPGTYTRKKFGYLAVEKPNESVRREYGLHMTPEQAVDKLGMRGRLSIVKEIKQLIDRKSWHGVRLSDIAPAERKRIIPCKLFVKEKYTASGDFDKVKSRLVAGGHRQDARVYKDKTSSPTVSTCCVLAIATIAHTERRAVATVDVPGAYLNAIMPTETRVRMRLNRFVSDIVIQLDPTYTDFICDDGCLIVELDKALYGLKESALLWYQLLCDKLCSIGFAKNRYEQCVFNRVESDGTQSSLCFHVDDLMITAKDEIHLDRVLEDIKSVLGDVNVTRGTKHNYLGMTFDFEHAAILRVHMTSTVENILSNANVGDDVATSPASNNLFSIDVNSALLNDEDREYFHSIVAMLLYLAKRVRPDLLLAVSFLSTRVKNPTVQDMNKLVRALKYLNGTKLLGLSLKGEDVVSVCAYIDASYRAETRVRMRLNRFVSDIVIQLDPTYTDFICDDGCLIVELDKALYGLKESALLWYQLLCDKLCSIGFAKNRYEQCVFNRVESDGTQSSLCFHVDDLMITAKDEIHLDRVLEDIKSVLGDVNVTRGTKHNYLGMTFDFEHAAILRVHMTSTVENILSNANVGDDVATSPASNNLFSIDVNSALLNDEDREYFHSIVAMLLYLAKRVRPDLLLAVSFLSTRVKNPTVQDMNKLVRALKYLNGTKLLGLSLKGEDVVSVCAYMDASYGVHDDFKSHSGVFVSLGVGPIFTKSSKQKLNSKSSTEAEMIAVSDGLNHVLWLRNFLEDQGYRLPPARIFQDNMSAIRLFQTGKCSSSTRTRHIAIRFYFVKDRIDSGEVAVSFIGTSDMIADMLTKPLQGAKFRELRGRLMGESLDT